LNRQRHNGFEDLKCWQLARQLMLECHHLAEKLPAKERYDLASQIRRSSKSGMANISEGYGRYHYLDSLRFYYFARGSINETINHIITAHTFCFRLIRHNHTMAQYIFCHHRHIHRCHKILPTHIGIRF